MASELEQWDITSSVGLTALGVAAARAVETHRTDRLISDPFAEPFVQAAEPPEPLPTRPEHIIEESSREVWDVMANYMAMRSRFFDDYFRAAGDSGVEQAVLLAAGLDTRALRLHWASGSTVYEVDQDKVLTFKQTVLDGLGAEPRCVRRPVSADLREDWVGALRAAGFDPNRPTAWLAEGLLPYLPGPAEENLFDQIHELSAPGSRIAIEYAPDARAMQDSPMFQTASDQFGVDVRTLWRTDSRRDSVGWLKTAGWSVELETAPALAEHYQRPLPDELPEAMNQAGLATAIKQAS